uniref:ankyrin repeat and zinc finger domain-containing protein 1-like n=1 Tax=Erigeron canadensis TaxID=72917 RepID=UPI001CB9B2A8|nr:ankyrin repeat and zinc finger domain-containing protein 1-like [Erigeron canadensis]
MDTASSELETESTSGHCTTAAVDSKQNNNNNKYKKRSHSIFEVPSSFFHSVTISSNIKQRIIGVREDDFDEWTSNSTINDHNTSSTSVSEEEDDRDSSCLNNLTLGLYASNKQKLFLRLPNGETFSLWKCLLLGDSEKIVFENDSCGFIKDDDTPFVTVREVTQKLLNVIREPRNHTHLRVVLLASGGHFAGCVFDGNSVVAHKALHRYVVRAKAGKKQSSEDASGKTAHSAGASVRRHNELALKKDIREIFVAWKPYFDLSDSIFIHAPSHNRQLLFDGANPCFSCQRNVIRHIPLTVRRPTFKEAQRLYRILTQISFEPDEEITPIAKEDSSSTLGKENLSSMENEDISEKFSVKNVEHIQVLLPLHEAAKDGNAEKVLELLEQGFDPCAIDEKGRTAYRVATEKEVRNTFRRFMALNRDKWDWQAAKVPCPLTKEMEESQKAKQAKKDSRRKERAKELKVLRKARLKKTREDVSPSHQGSHWFSNRAAGVLVLVIGSLLVVAFGQKGRGSRKY